MQTILTNKKDFPTLLSIINKAIDQAIKEQEQKSINKKLTK